MNLESLLQIIHALTMLLLIAPSTSHPPHCNLTLKEGREEYSCDSEELHLTVKVQVNVQARINCHGQTLTCENFPKIPATHNRKLPSLLFDSCSLPPSLSCLIEKLDANEVGTLRVENCTELVGEQIQSVKGLTDLWIRDSVTQKTIPFDAMALIPTLTDVKVHNTQFSFTPLSTPNYQLKTMELLTHSIKYIPKGAFRTLKNLTKLCLYENDIKNISEGTFDGLENLQYLDLSRNPLTGLPARAFAGAPSIREIKLHKHSMETVASDAFKGLELLEKISIKRGQKLLKFENQALSNLPNLKSITIESCPLTHLPNDLFTNSKAIVNLTVSSCSVKELPEGIFRDQTEMKTLKLNNNKIEKIPEKLLWTLVNLEELNLNGNLIEELPGQIFEGLASLTTIQIDSNNLRTIPRSTFNGPINLTKLSLKNNHLTLLDNGTEKNDSPFSNLDNIRELDLSDNYIDRIFDDWRLTWIHAIEKIDLSHNRIQILKPKDLEFLGHKVTVDLQHNNITSIAIGPNLLTENTIRYKRATFILDNNPLSCDCSLHTFLNFTRHHESPRFIINNSLCNSPTDLYLQKLQDISLDALTCEEKECPDGCFCVKQPQTSTLELDCIETPNWFPDPTSQNLSKSKIRLRKFRSLLHLPDHVVSLDLHGLALTEIPVIPDTVLELDVSFNHLSVIPKEFLRHNLTLYIQGNEIDCGCWHRENLEIMIKSNIIKDYNLTKCEGGLNLNNVNLKTVCDGWWATVIGSTLAAMGTVAVISAFVAYYYVNEIVKIIYGRGWPLPPGVYEDEIDNKQFDVLISYSDSYEKIVISHLVPMIRKAGYSVCIRCVDWDVGDFLPNKVTELVDKSRRTVVLLSSDYFESDARLELRAALLNERRSRRKRVVPVVTGDLKADPRLEKFLQARPNLALSDASFWERLKRQLPKKRKGKIVKQNQKIQNVLLTEQKMLFNSKMSLNQL